jgi:hypothetical protein
VSRAFLLACVVVIACAPQLEEQHDDRPPVAVALPLDATANESSRWQVLAGPAHLYALQTSAASAGGLWFSFTPDFGSTIGSVSARLSGGAPLTSEFRHAALPETMPEVRLFMLDDGEAIEIARAVDASESVEAYDRTHDVTLSAHHAVIPGVTYAIRVSGESGANSAASTLSLVGLSATIGGAE